MSKKVITLVSNKTRKESQHSEVDAAILIASGKFIKRSTDVGDKVKAK